jgi:hypothetical protein
MDLLVQPWMNTMRVMRPLHTPKQTHLVPRNHAEVTWNDLEKIGATHPANPPTAGGYTTPLALLAAGFAMTLLTLVFGSVVAGGTWLALDANHPQPSMSSTAE